MTLFDESECEQIFISLFSGFWSVDGVPKLKAWRMVSELETNAFPFAFCRRGFAPCHLHKAVDCISTLNDTHSAGLSDELSADLLENVRMFMLHMSVQTMQVIFGHQDLPGSNHHQPGFGDNL